MSCKTILCYSKALSRGRDFLKLYNRQKKNRQKKIQVIPSHFNNLKSNWQKPNFFITPLRLWLIGHRQVTPTKTRFKTVTVSALARVKGYSTVPTELWTDWKNTKKLKICTTRPQGLSAAMAGETVKGCYLSDSDSASYRAQTFSWQSSWWWKKFLMMQTSQNIVSIISCYPVNSYAAESCVMKKFMLGGMKVRIWRSLI